MVWSRLKATFRKLLLIPSTSSANAPAQLAADIQSGESFTRFILSRKQFSAEKGRVKPPALTPMFNDKKHRLETSTHRVEGLATSEIWQIGYSHVENAAEGRLIRARGTGLFSLATSQGLALDVNGPPVPRHVDIIGWSAADKDVRLMQQTEIADKLQLEIDPRPKP